MTGIGDVSKLALVLHRGPELSNFNAIVTLDSNSAVESKVTTLLPSSP